MEFKSFSSLIRLDKTQVEVTQKLHGSNASVWIYKDISGVMQVKAAKRTSFLESGEDNFGFRVFVEERAQQFIDLLGEGVHWGEWCGPGINSGEGLTQKRFVLFNTAKADAPRPDRVDVVPVLWRGALEDLNINEIMNKLKTEGSVYVPGFMRPEGIVIHIRGLGLIKNVFEAEETKWKGKENRVKKPSSNVDVSHLLQPIRLEKLLSRDEIYTKDYPETLPRIASDYVADLIKEDQIQGDADTISAIKKQLGSKLFGFIKANIKLN